MDNLANDKQSCSLDEGIATETYTLDASKANL